jgi:predicted transcriptional regulator
MFNDAPQSPIGKKQKILAALAIAKKLIFPKQLHEATGIEKYELGELLRQLRTEGLVLLLENGVYTITEKGIEQAKAEKMKIHPTAKGRAERYKTAGNVMPPPEQSQESKKSAPAKAHKAKKPAQKAKAPAAEKKPTEAKPGTIAELFSTDELTEKGAFLLLRLLKSLQLEDLQKAGFTNEEVYEFGDVYRFVKDRAEVAEVMQ